MGILAFIFTFRFLRSLILLNLNFDFNFDYFNLFLTILILNFGSQIVLINFGFTCKCFRLLISTRLWLSILGFSIDFNFKYFISHLTPMRSPLLLSFVLVLVILSILILEFRVSFIQAYVFTCLPRIWLRDA